MAKVATDLVTKFSFEGSLAPLEKFNNGMGISLKQVGVFTGMIAGAMGGIAAWVGSISAANDATGQLARTTGVSVEAIGELGYAASQNGSSVEAMRSSLSGLNRNIGQAAQGFGRGKEALEKLGISIRDAAGNTKTADRVFMDFSRRARELNLSGAEVQGLAERLGIDASLVQTIQLSSDALDGLRLRAIAMGRVTTEQSDQMLKYNDTLGTLGRVYDGLKVQLASAFIPTLNKLAESFTGRLIDASESITKAMGVLASAFGAIAESLARTAPVLLAVSAAMVVAKVATIGLAGAVRLLRRALPIAALTALYVIVDDVMTAFSGGESVISRLYRRMTDGRSLVSDFTSVWRVLASAFEVVIIAAKQLWSVVSPVLSAFGNTAAGALSNDFKILGGVMGELLTVAGKLWPVVSPLFKFLGSLALDVTILSLRGLVAVLNGAFTAISAVLGVVVPLFKIMGDFTVDAMTKGWEKFTAAIKSSVEFLKEVFAQLKQISDAVGLTATANFLGDAGSSAVDIAGDYLGAAGDSISRFFGGGSGTDAPAPMAAPFSPSVPVMPPMPVMPEMPGMQAMQAAPAPQISNQSMITGGAVTTTSNRTVNQDVRINVQSSDPVQAGQEIRGKMQSMLTDSQNQIGARVR